jgi:hypothetical protein
MFDLATSTANGLAASATGDFQSWNVEPDACWTYAGFGVGVGHVLGFRDEVTNDVVYNRRLTSDDLSQYTVEFDAWLEGTDPFINTALQVTFQGPEIDPNSGNPDTTPIQLDDVRQSFSFQLDELEVVQGDIFDWIDIPFSDTLQVQVQVQPQGDQDTVGFDADNTVFLDNVVFNAPFEEIVNASGDFDGDGLYDCFDIDDLIGEIAAGTNDAFYDLTGDGLVDLADRDAWLAEAGAVNNASGNPHLLGDFNLDGVVDVGDFNIWNSNKFTDTGAWCQGDANGDGVSDVGDFNLWNGNKFTASDAAAVPEPGSIVLSLIAALGMLSLRRRS